MWNLALTRWLFGFLLLLPVFLPPDGAPIARAQSTTDTWFVLDREGWLRTDDSRLVLTTYDLSNGPNLAAVPLKIGDWSGADQEITNLDTFPTLDADFIIYRSYTRPGGHSLLFSLVGSTRGQSFHHPLICYQWADWPAEDRGTTTISLGSSDVVLRVVVGYDPEGPPQVDLHGYLWPNDRRDWGDGATQIRVTAFATAGEEQALADAREFARLLFKSARRLDAPAPPAPTLAPAAEPPRFGPSPQSPAP